MMHLRNCISCQNMISAVSKDYKCYMCRRLAGELTSEEQWAAFKEYFDATSTDSSTEKHYPKRQKHYDSKPIAKMFVPPVWY